MGEEIAFENGRISDFQGLMTLTLDRVILHTVMHHSSTSTYIANLVEIKETFSGRTDGRTYGRTDIWDPLMLWYWNWKISTTYANHVFHADTDLAVAVESSVEADDVRRVALVKHHQLTNDLITHSRFDLQMYQLQDHTTKLTTVINNVYVRWQLRNFFILIYAVLTRVVTTNEISLPAPNQHRHRGVLQCSWRSFWTLFPENCPSLP